MNSKYWQRVRRVALMALGSLLFWVWVYHVLIGGADPVSGVIYTAVTLGLVMVVTVVTGLWLERRSGGSGK